MKFRHQKGFTLVELLVVIAILAVLATVSVVGYTAFIEKAAVEADESLVAQLNKFLVVYEIENDSVSEENLPDLFATANVEELSLQSEKYGYSLYFNAESARFVLLPENAAGTNSGLIKITKDIMNPNEDGDEDPEYNEDEPINPGEGQEGTEGGNEGTEGGNEDTEGGNEGTEGGNEGIEGGNEGTEGGNEGEGSETPETPEAPSFQINTNTLPSISDKLYKDYKVYAEYDEETGELNVYVSINVDDSTAKCTYLPINLSKFITLNNFGIEFSCTLIDKVTYENYDTIDCGYDITINAQGHSILTLYNVGTYTLEYTCGVSSDNVQINVINSYYNKAELQFDGISRGDVSVKIEDDDIKAIIKFTNIMMISDIFYENGSHCPNNYKLRNLERSTVEQYINDGRIVILMDGEKLELSKVDNNYCAIIEDLMPGNDYTHTITFMFKGFNGEWVSMEKTLSFSIEKTTIRNILWE